MSAQQKCFWHKDATGTQSARDAEANPNRGAGEPLTVSTRRRDERYQDYEGRIIGLSLSASCGILFF